MPNQSSHAGHIPYRTCIICKNKIDKKLLLGLFIMNREIVFDVNGLVSTRKKYVCHKAECLTILNKWLDKHLKKSGKHKRTGTV